MVTYYVGWDVGAWCCKDKASAASHDAIAVFNSDFELVSHGCGNIKKELKKSDNFAEFLSKFTVGEDRRSVQFCASNHFVIAIDAVLGMPKNFMRLMTKSNISREKLAALFPDGKNIENVFLFRRTEMNIAPMLEKHNPLSVVLDRIGSQSTKAIFLLKYLGFVKGSCAHWIDNYGNIAIETYPAPIKKNYQEALKSLPETSDNDLQDAFVCAWVAKEYALGNCTVPNRCDLTKYVSEGWIFVPKPNSDTEKAPASK